MVVLGHGVRRGDGWWCRAPAFAAATDVGVGPRPRIETFRGRLTERLSVDGVIAERGDFRESQFLTIVKDPVSPFAHSYWPLSDAPLPTTSIAMPQ